MISKNVRSFTSAQFNFLFGFFSSSGADREQITWFNIIHLASTTRQQNAFAIHQECRGRLIIHANMFALSHRNSRIPHSILLPKFIDRPILREVGFSPWIFLLIILTKAYLSNLPRIFHGKAIPERTKLFGRFFPGMSRSSRKIFPAW